MLMLAESIQDLLEKHNRFLDWHTLCDIAAGVPDYNAIIEIEPVTAKVAVAVGV